MPDPDISAYAGERGTRWARRLDAVAATVREPRPLVEGRLTRAAGLTLEARGCHAALGTRCLIQNSDDTTVEAEVVGFADERTFLMPTGAMHGVMPRAPVIPTGADSRVGVGEALLGRVIDGAGNALDRGGPVYCDHRAPLQSAPINPLTRAPINEPLDVGVRSMNALFTAGRGQRLGLFAGSGIGKSSLLAMMTRYTRADVIVVGLIGERGREVKEFVEDNLGEDAMSRAVVVATPADSSPLMRVHGAWRATSIAEHFRKEGHDVLLLMDSLTRFAQAQREIGLAIGEPPATKGYPPSVFARLPQLVERAGTGRDGAGSGRGSITAFYTVLAEGDDEQDPIVDAARAILDGHIMLSRDISESGIYPPVDVERSVSRSMPRVANERHVEAARRFREIYSYYMRHRDLITVGAYRPGGDPLLDHAVALWPAMQKFLAQSLNEAVGLNDSIAELIALVDSKPAMPAKEPEEPADTTAKEKMNAPQR